MAMLNNQMVDDINLIHITRCPTFRHLWRAEVAILKRSPKWSPAQEDLRDLQSGHSTGPSAAGEPGLMLLASFSHQKPVIYMG
jgi:hypothetical protein